MLLPEKPKNFQELFNTGWVLCKKTFFEVFPFTLFISILNLILQPRSKPTLEDSMDWAAIGIFVLGVLLLSALHAAVVKRIYTIGKGSKALSYYETIIVGIRKMFPVFFVTIVYFIFLVLGLAIFILPGLYLSVLLYFAFYLIVIERKGIRFAFLESIRLVKNQWWKTFGFLLILLFIYIFVQSMIELVLGEQVVLTILLVITWGAFYWPFMYSCILVLLKDLELRKTSHH